LLGENERVVRYAEAAVQSQLRALMLLRWVNTPHDDQLTGPVEADLLRRRAIQRLMHARRLVLLAEQAAVNPRHVGVLDGLLTRLDRLIACAQRDLGRVTAREAPDVGARSSG
jgi:hypothetical protein